MSASLHPAAAPERPLAEALITEVRGSAPAVVGDGMCLLADGRFAGTVGGGRMEHALKAALQADPQVARGIDFTLGHGTDQCCGGRAQAHIVPVPPLLAALYAPGASRVYAVADGRLHLAGGVTAEGRALGSETHATLAGADAPGYLVDGSRFVLPTRRRTPLWLFGAGHVGRAVARIAADLDYAVRAFDARPEWADPLAFPSAAQVSLTIDPAALPKPPADAVVLIMTHSHTLDFELLAHFAARPLAYLGVIASRSKAARFHHALEREDLAPRNLHMPIGLPGIGKRPAEIAVSVMAELLALRAAAAEGTAWP